MAPWRGRYWDMGLSAVVEVEGPSRRDLPNLLLLTPKRVIPFSLHQNWSSQDLAEQAEDIWWARHGRARAAYEPVAARIVEVIVGNYWRSIPKNLTSSRAGWAVGDGWAVTRESWLARRFGLVEGSSGGSRP